MTIVQRFARHAAGTVFAAASLLLLAPHCAAAITRSPLKQLQVRRLAEEPMRERLEQREHREFARERLRELKRLARAMKKDGRTSLRAGGESARPWVEDEDLRAGRPAPARAAAPLSASATTGPPRPNVRCNDTAGDGLQDGQCETAIVRWNNYMLAAWNDGTGFTNLTNQTQGWATSIDGGVTWVDRGSLPHASTGWVWSSDPVLAVNPTTGAFYYAGLADSNTSLSAIGVLKGRFTGSSFAWGPLSAARLGPASSDFLDKQWIAVDPASGRVCLSYTDFVGASTSQIEFQSADSSLAVWTGPIQVSPSSENGAVQGSRPIVSPDGTIHVVYYLIGPVDVDYYRICRSTNGGASFAAPVSAISAYTNFGTGAPGFNRNMGIQFPSIAVDRSGGAHNGRLYLSWAESLNWYDDYANLGFLGTTAEVEPNDTFGQATTLAAGKIATGSLNASSDLFDWYGITLAAGQGLIVSADALSTGLTITTRLFATDGTTRLTYTTASDAEIAAGVHPVWIYTAPTAGKYYLRVSSFTGSGTYSVSTCAAVHGGERGRDQRDAFVSFSDNGGTSWSPPARVSASAVGFDDWLPEVAVGANGDVYAAWYDWRDAAPTTNGGESSVYLARSADGGVTWAELGATSDARTTWTGLNTNIVPNEGDYLSLFADAGGLSVAWSDGRGGTPDVFMSYWTQSELAAVAPPVTGTLALGRAQPNPVLSSSLIAFTLTGSADATLDLLDLNGRRVWTRSVSQGMSPVLLADGRKLRPGVYFVRLTQYSLSRSRRIVVL